MFPDFPNARWMNALLVLQLIQPEEQFANVFEDRRGGLAMD
jgi:hypothetical protein